MQQGRGKDQKNKQRQKRKEKKKSLPWFGMPSGAGDGGEEAAAGWGLFGTPSAHKRFGFELRNNRRALM